MKQVPVSEAIRRKYPEWLTLVVTADNQGRPNAMAAGWCMVASGKPPMMAVSVAPARYTHDLIEARREFVLAFPAEGQGEGALAVGSRSGRNCPDKLTEAGLLVVPGAVVGVPLIDGAAVNLECTLAGRLRTGDHTIFVGEVVAAHVADPPVERIVNFGTCFAVGLPKEETALEF